MSDIQRKGPYKSRPSNTKRKPSFSKPVIASGSQSRAAAALCVNAVEEGNSLSTALPMYTKDLDDRDRAFVQEIVYGTLRHKRLLSTTASELLDRGINQRFNQVRTLIICALYQIIFTRSPAHAVVAATVGACDLIKCRKFTGVVNAVLRRFLREGAHLVHSSDPCVEHSFPKWLFDELSSTYTEDEVLEIMKNSNVHPPMYLRVENSKISTEDYLKSLEKKEIGASAVEQCPSAVLLDEPEHVSRLPYFEQGYVAVQDISAQMAAPLLDLKDGMRVLDTCAAPGGKSAHILDLAKDIDLISCDIDEKRLEETRRGLSRLNRNPVLKQIDASESLNGIEGEFDRILVDAPCSGTGVIRRHPDIKWLRRQKDIEKLVQTQKKILDNAFAKLKKGGILVYTTCSILKRENIEQVRSFLNRHTDARLLPFIMNGNEVETYQRLPGELNADGFFYARFIKE